jgi:hypothetical protein
MCRDRFQIESFVGANYDNTIEDAGPGSVAASAEIIETVLAKADLAGKIPVKQGSAPLRYQFEPSDSEGVDFIIEKAMASTPEDPLWVIGLGAATDIASAYLKEPRIADHVIVFWHFRTRWPDKCWNFNVIGDVRAARIVFHSDLPFVLSTPAPISPAPWKNRNGGPNWESWANICTSTASRSPGTNAPTRASTTWATSPRW